MNIQDINYAIASKGLDVANTLNPVAVDKATPTIRQIITTLKTGEKIGAIEGITMAFPTDFQGKICLTVYFNVADAMAKPPVLVNIPVYLPSGCFQELMAAKNVGNSDGLWGFGKRYGLDRLEAYYYSLGAVGDLKVESLAGFFTHVTDKWFALSVQDGVFWYGSKSGWQALQKYFEMSEWTVQTMFTDKVIPWGDDPKKELMRRIKAVLWSEMIHVS